jgi:hypothetical protein
MDKDEIRRLGNEIRDKQTELVALVKAIAAAQGNDGYDLQVRIVLLAGQIKGSMRGVGLKFKGTEIVEVPEDAEGVPLEGEEGVATKAEKPTVQASAIVSDIFKRLGVVEGK